MMPIRIHATLRIAALIMLSGLSVEAADVLTYHNDNARTGQNLNEVILAPSNVNSATFGRIFTASVDGKVDAQPLYVSGVSIPGQGVHNVLIVATEHDSVYAFDADTGAQLWRVSLLKAGETTSDNRNCGQVDPEIGVTGTPVIDLKAGPNGTIYVIGMSKNASSKYFQRLHALDLTSGAEQFGGPVDIQAAHPGNGDNSSGGNVIFDPKQYKARPGLLLLNGIVYTSWSSHCDISPYTAWVIGYAQLTLKQSTVVNLTPNGHEASVWQAGGAPAADASGNIYFLLANGTFDSVIDSQSFPVNGDYGNAFMKLRTNGNLAVADYFATFDTFAQSAADQDLGSGGAMVLPDLLDSQGRTRHLAVGAGKDAHIYVVDRDNMGKYNPVNNNQIYQQLSSSLGGSVFSMPAFFGGKLYYGAVGAKLKAFPFSNGVFASSPSSQSANSFGYPGTTPSISASGSSNGIVWAAENSNPAVLRAYDASNLATELYNSNQAANNRDRFGAGNKFITPTVASGKVYVGTTNSVGAFGILAGSVTPVIVSPMTSPATMGSRFAYQIAATNGPTGFGAPGLPLGLSFNPATGVIGGTPTAVGVTLVEISATNTGGTGTATLTITVSDPCVATLNPAKRQLSGGADSSTVTVSIGSTCSWQATTDSPSWITLTGGAGTGGGGFSFSAGANVGETRLGTIAIGGVSFKVMQPGPTPIFNDVAAGAPYMDYISLMYRNGITAGCSASPLLYCPDTPVTRAQMAVFIVVALNLGTATPMMNVPTGHFEDVSSSSTYFPFIQRLSDLGITAGCSTNPPLFCPDTTITQAQMAVFVAVAWMQANNLSSFAYTLTPYFTDVPATDPYFKFIQKVRDLGFWSGCSANQYCPASNVTRAQMAPMVMRSLIGAP